MAIQSIKTNLIISDIYGTQLELNKNDERLLGLSNKYRSDVTDSLLKKLRDIDLEEAIHHVCHK